MFWLLLARLSKMSFFVLFLVVGLSVIFPFFFLTGRSVLVAFGVVAEQD